MPENKIINQVPGEILDITLDEIKMALKKMKKNKAPGKN